MTAVRACWVLGALTLGVFPPAFADGPLRHDPFARPVLSATLPRATGAQATPVNEELPWTPVLSAVMVAGNNSMVNVDGTVVTIGEEKDGYRLVQVTEQEAVFKKGKKRIVLKTQPSPLRQNNERAAP